MASVTIKVPPQAKTYVSEHPLPGRPEPLGVQEVVSEVREEPIPEKEPEPIAEKPIEMVPNPGVGMPASLLLQQFGEHVMRAFDSKFPPFLVGSALFGKKWRDVDVRLILTDEEYESWGLGDPRFPQSNQRWVSLVLAWSAFGRNITHLPIDFQIQQQSWANEHESKSRSALFVLCDVPR